MGVYIKGVGKKELIDILRYENIFDAIDVSEFIEVEEPLNKDIKVLCKTEPQVVMPKKCKGCDSASKIIEAYSKGWADGAEAVKAMPQTEKGDK